MRTGRISAVRGKDGQPPYLVDWSSGHTGLFFPNGDCFIEHELLVVEPIAPVAPVARPDAKEEPCHDIYDAVDWAGTSA